MIDNQEIRAKARMLYKKHFGFVLLLGFCSGGILNLISNFADYLFPKDWGGIAMVLLLSFACIPLTVGAVACMEALWLKDGCMLDSLLCFYAPLSRLGSSLLLEMLPTLLLLLLVVPGGLFYLSGDMPAWGILLLLIFLFWFCLRLQMAMMLFASGREKSALSALCISYQRMRGKVWDLLGMTVVLMLPMFLVMFAMQLYTQQYGTNLLVLLLGGLFQLLYMPYSTLAEQGWVLERLKDGEQPQESENKRNQEPFLTELKKEVKPSSEKMKEQ
ncbi:MAG: hypothetical protein KHY89_04615 [Butyricicoccus pullicaecorum]|nr:hypothetical protein [Butyricicoccus pullicaecorum]